jgi:hypothetical protein
MRLQSVCLQSPQIKRRIHFVKRKKTRIRRMESVAMGLALEAHQALGDVPAAEEYNQFKKYRYAKRDRGLTSMLLGQ